MPRKRLFAFLVILLVAFAFAGSPGRGSAQTAPVVWSEPVNISNTPTDSFNPAIVADAYGRVHVFWAENYPEYGSLYNVIYYARMENEAWSQPVSILTSPEDFRGVADEPAVAIGKDNRLHLVFVGGVSARIYYSSAAIDQALNARAWSKPVPLSQQAINCGSPNIALDPQGDLRVVYHSAQGWEQGIHHMQSSDNGLSWSFPERIPGVNTGANILLGDTRMAVAPDGSLHVAWMWTKATEIFPPKGVLYIHSSDAEGKTWGAVQTIADGPYRFPDLAFDGNSNLHLVWSGTTPDRYKFSQWSPDNGRTWSPRITMPRLGGFQGYTGMADDSLGRVNLAMVASYFGLGDTLIHSVWEGDHWTEPVPFMVNTVRENNPNGADIAISQGNLAHLVVAHPTYELIQGSAQARDKTYQYEIIYFQGQLDAPQIPLLPTPTSPPLAPTQTVENDHPQASATAPLHRPALPVMITDPAKVELNTSDTVLLAVVPVVLLLSFVFVLRKRK